MTIDRLQRSQNNLARVVCQRGGCTDAADTELVAGEASCHVQDSGAGTQSPDDIDTAVLQGYARDSYTSKNSEISNCSIHNTELARRAFCVAALSVWNSLDCVTLLLALAVGGVAHWQERWSWSANFPVTRSTFS